MPIYDNDGTANHEIGKLYDYNGSANTQIGKVYDNNGTTNSLIYSAEVYGWNGGNTGYTVNPRTYNEGYAYTSTFQVGSNPTSHSRAAALAWVNLDFTGFSTLTITYSYYNWYYAGGRVGYGTNFSTFAMNQSDSYYSSLFTACSGSVPAGTKETATSGTLTWTANIASVNGSRQVGAWAHSDSGAGQAKCWIQIKSILLT